MPRWQGDSKPSSIAVVISTCRSSRCIPDGHWKSHVSVGWCCHLWPVLSRSSRLCVISEHARDHVQSARYWKRNIGPTVRLHRLLEWSAPFPRCTHYHEGTQPTTRLVPTTLSGRQIRVVIVLQWIPSPCPERDEELIPPSSLFTIFTRITFVYSRYACGTDLLGSMCMCLMCELSSVSCSHCQLHCMYVSCHLAYKHVWLDLIKCCTQIFNVTFCYMHPLCSVQQLAFLHYIGCILFGICDRCMLISIGSFEASQEPALLSFVAVVIEFRTAHWLWQKSVWRSP